MQDKPSGTEDERRCSMSNLSLWTRRDPFAEFDALFRDTFANRLSARSAEFTPAAEILRDGEDAVVRVELPGVDVKDDVTVEVDGDQLVIRGERRDERAEEKEGRTLREFRYGAFQRSFTLPKHVTADAISASYDAGVLSVRVADAYAGTKTRHIAITAS
jgi:HSP20 family molecular chaperone IbpA